MRRRQSAQDDRRWCREQDLNLHAFWALDPKSNASANSAIPAFLTTISQVKVCFIKRLAGHRRQSGQCQLWCQFDLACSQEISLRLSTHAVTFLTSRLFVIL